MRGKNQLLHGFSGRLENMSVRYYDSRSQVIQGLPQVYHDAQSEEQLIVRNAFQENARLAQSLRPFLVENLQKIPGRLNWFNYWMKNGGRKGEGEERLMVKKRNAKTLITEGPLQSLGAYYGGDDLGVGDPNDYSIILKWNNPGGGLSGNPADPVRGIAIYDDTNNFFEAATGATRGDTQATFTFPRPNGTEVILGIFCKDPNTGEVSTDYLIARVDDQGTITAL